MKHDRQEFSRFKMRGTQQEAENFKKKTVKLIFLEFNFWIILLMFLNPIYIDDFMYQRYPR